MSLPEIGVHAESLERIYGVSLAMQCGRFVAVNVIPDDWSVTVEGPVSEQTRLVMVAGHGASALFKTGELSAFATIMICASECFTISGAVTLADSEDRERVVNVTQAELIFNAVK